MQQSQKVKHCIMKVTSAKYLNESLPPPIQIFTKYIPKLNLNAISTDQMYHILKLLK